MADVSKLYKGVWSGTTSPAEAKAQASSIYGQAAAETAESACFRAGVNYGSSGAAESANFSVYRQCGREFGAKVARPSKAVRA